MRHRFLAFLILLLSGALSASLAAQDEGYRLSAGDSVDVRVFGRPDLSGIFRLRETGDLTFPLLGSVPAAGLTVAALETTLSKRLVTAAVESAQVSVAVAEFSPVYLNGDVTAPGAYPYRPGLTVAKAIALAGGRFSIRQVSTNMPLAISELQERFLTLLDSYWTGVAREARLLAERSGASTISFPPDLTREIGSGRVAEIVANEAAVFETRRDERAAQAATLDKRGEEVAREMKLLTDQEASVRRTHQLIRGQIEALAKLTQQGILPKAQAVSLEIQAAALEQEARAAAVALVRARQQVIVLEAQIEGLRLDKAIETASNLQNVQDSLIRTRTQLREMDARLSAMRSALGRSLGPDRESERVPNLPALVTVMRASGERLELDVNAPLAAGDVVDVPFPEPVTIRELESTLRLPERARASGSAASTDAAASDSDKPDKQ